jgi:hypothetical protein
MIKLNFKFIIMEKSEYIVQGWHIAGFIIAFLIGGLFDLCLVRLAFVINFKDAIEQARQEEAEDQLNLPDRG